MADEIARVLRELRQLRTAAEAADWTVPPEPEWLDPLRQYRLRWEPVERRLEGEPMELETLRMVAIPERIEAHVAGDGQSILLVRVPAGAGKTYAAVQASQKAGRAGLRVLYCASRHNFFGDLQAIPGFDPGLWYHWLPIRKSEGEDDPLPETCRFANALHVWLRKGYGAFDLCEQLCVADGWLALCPYRRQRARPERIIFAMHNHLASGLAISDFDLAIVDELPLQAFVSRRLIPTSGLDVGATGPLGDLIAELAALSGEAQGQRVNGRRLFDRIGPVLRDVYAQVELLPDMLPTVPRVSSAAMVKEVPYWYVFDLLRLASPEYDAWRSGWPRWAERVWVSEGGLWLLDRALPWKDLPRRMVVLDATGQPGIYETLFGREVDVFAPRVKRPGRIYQVTHRLNGINSLVDSEGNATDRARDLVAIASQLTDRHEGRVAVVTHKRLEALFASRFGEGNVLHFHAVRGTNQLQDVSCLIVAGAPAPTIASVVDLATALSPGRVRSFITLDERGHERPLWVTRRLQYLVTDDVVARHGGKAPFRGVGLFADPELQTVFEQLREEELVQAIHRARPNVRACEVWLLTSIPTGEPMDGVWDDPPVAPPGISWPAWTRVQAWLRDRRGLGLPVTNADLALAMGVSEGWVRERQMLASIIAAYPDEWEPTTLAPRGGGRGRRTDAAKPIWRNFAGSCS